MEKCITTESLREDTWSVLEAMARKAVRKVLQQALEIEVAECVEVQANRRDERAIVGWYATAVRPSAAS